MPAFEILERFNPMLADPGTGGVRRLRDTLDAAETLRDAVEAAGILDTVDARVALEARAVLDAIPAAGNEAVVSALESAFDRSVPVSLYWVRIESATVEVRVSEEPDGDRTRVRIGFASPDGRDFLR